MNQTPATHEESMSRTGSDAPSSILIAFAVLTVFLAGAGIGWLVRPPAEETPVVAEDTTTTTVATESPAGSDLDETPPRSTAPVSEPATGPLVDSESVEPAADVAEALLPSVVQIELQGGLGSGVIYDPNGRIMTAAHVVDGYETVEVRLFNGDRTLGTVVGVDRMNDIAVIEVDRTELPAAPLALDSAPRPGQLAIALGSPWGLDSTVTSGIISAVDQTIIGDGNVPRLMLQTDASINPGNSGGPLADRQGRIVGINVSIYSTSGASDGVGFAVPIDRAYRVATAIVEGREFIPGFLGVSIQPSETGQAGSVITEITPDSAAEEAGLQLGDLVVAVNGDPIGDFTDLAAVVRNYEAGDVIDIEIERDGESRIVPVELGSRPSAG